MTFGDRWRDKPMVTGGNLGDDQSERWSAWAGLPGSGPRCGWRHRVAAAAEGMWT
jgi:hypothetical protein